MINDAKLIEYNFYGFIPGPREETAAFLKRIGLTQATKPFHKEMTLVRSLFDVYPSWVRIEFTDQLPFWEVAATYMELNQGVFIPIIQIKKRGIPFWCSQEEILAHELVHATRIAFSETFFEEILAYKTSNNWFRRFFGPIFFRPVEVILFLFFLMGLWFCQLGCLFWFDDMPNFTLWALFIIMGLLMIRLIVVQSIFSLCLKKIRKILKQPEKALKFALRLSDKEISCFAFKSLNKMRKHILQEQKNSLRWRMLTLTYPMKKEELS